MDARGGRCCRSNFLLLTGRSNGFQLLAGRRRVDTLQGKRLTIAQLRVPAVFALGVAIPTIDEGEIEARQGIGVRRFVELRLLEEVLQQQIDLLTARLD